MVEEGERVAQRVCVAATASCSEIVFFIKKNNFFILILFFALALKKGFTIIRANNTEEASLSNIRKLKETGMNSIKYQYFLFQEKNV